MKAPRLSVVIVAYNMARELPRTIRTLSPQMQRDIGAEDYEIIVVDNGSTRPFDESECGQKDGNVSFCYMEHPSPSPSAAVNRGLSLARGHLVGVFIDGARMASPRLLATALDAANLHSKPVIGTLAFHLGPDIQNRSMANGYCQQAEDELLDTVDWKSDGYSLFSISVFGGSSARGWFDMPAESNALFLTREHWRELGGYDEAFTSPGGGLVNLDTWKRACDDPAGQIIILLGEATFHQFHGGVMTNSSSTAGTMPFFREEYQRLRGSSFSRSRRRPFFFGTLPPAVVPSLRSSIEHLAASSAKGK